MNAAEFTALTRKLQGTWWAFPVPEAGFTEYAKDLRGLDFAAVDAALDALKLSGQDRAPTTGQIRRKVVELEMSPPSWTDARADLMQWRRGATDRQANAEAWKCPHALCSGNGFAYDEDTNTATPCRCRPQYLAALRGTTALPVLLREFVDGRHVNGGELDILFDGFDTTLEAQIRQRWQQFIGRAVESRMLAGLPSDSGLARIEAARTEDEEHPERTKRAELRMPQRMNPLEALALPSLAVIDQ